MRPDQIRRLFDYTDWAANLAWAAVEQLTDAQFTADLGYSQGSIRNLLIHDVSAGRRWLGRLKRATPPPHLAFDDFPTRPSARAAWDRARGEWRAYLESLTDADLAESVPVALPGRGVQTENARWEILLHLVNHSTDHRSQILTLLSTRFGIATPEHDFIIYRWQLT
jgi:uncharacterized damage-inducible protein DinB